MDAELLFRPAGELARSFGAASSARASWPRPRWSGSRRSQPELNAFVHLDPEGALAAADAIGPDDPRPFAGVPIAIKDTAAVAGMPYTMGSDAFGDFVPGHDAFVVRRLREAGFVIVGKTNMPEFGILPVTEPRRFGPTRNPWDTERTPGGSSRRRRGRGGGRHGAARPRQRRRRLDPDPGGLLRPGRAEADAAAASRAAPTSATTSSSRTACSPARVAETAQLLDVLAGYEPGDATWAPPPPEPFAAAAAREPGRLRIGVTTTAADRRAARPDLRARRPRRRASCSPRSATRSRRSRRPGPARTCCRRSRSVFGTPIAMGLFFGGHGHRPRAERGAGRAALLDDLERDPRAQRARLPARAHAARRVHARHRRALGRPTTCCSRPRSRSARCGSARSTPAATTPGTTSARSGQFTPYTAIFNVTGQPAISLPLFHGDDGLPLAVQLGRAPGGRGRRCCRWPPSSRRRARGRERRPELARAAVDAALSPPRPKQPPCRGRRSSSAAASSGESQRSSSISSFGAKPGSSSTRHQPVAHELRPVRGPRSGRRAAPARAGSAAPSPPPPRAAPPPRTSRPGRACPSAATSRRSAAGAPAATRPSRTTTPPAASTSSLRARSRPRRRARRSPAAPRSPGASRAQPLHQRAGLLPVAPEQHGRARARDRRAQRARAPRRARPAPSSAGRARAGAAGAARRPGRARSARGRRAPGPARAATACATLCTASASGTSAGQRRPRRGGRHLDRRDRQHALQPGRRLEAHRRRRSAQITKPPSSAAATLSGWPSSSRGELEQRRVQLVHVVGRAQPRHDRRGARAEPGRRRDLRADREADAVGRVQPLEGAHAQVGAVERAPRARRTRTENSPVSSTSSSRWSDERGRQHVVAGAEVRRRRRHAHHAGAGSPEHRPLDARRCPARRAPPSRPGSSPSAGPSARGR